MGLAPLEKSDKYATNRDGCNSGGGAGHQLIARLVVGCSTLPSLASLGKILKIKLCPVEYKCIVIEMHTAFACLNELCCTKCMSRKALYKYH